MSGFCRRARYKVVQHSEGYVSKANHKGFTAAMSPARGARFGLHRVMNP